MKKNPLLDEVFLHELDLYPHKFVWAKIIALNWEEYPLEEITGRITSGSINVDGASAVRRTCSLTLAANEVNINNFYWSLNTKFKVEIGLENWINPEYPDIIWFKQGTFIISTFSCSVGVNNYTINIQGKDKMVLLNGEVGGTVPASWDFGTEDVTMEDGSIQNNQIPIKDIVLQAVHEYAQEGWQNIIVNDLDDYGIELLQYEGGTPLYYIIDFGGGDNDSREVVNMTLNGDMPCWVRQDTWENGKREVGSTYLETTISQIESNSETDDTSIAGRLCYEKLMEQLDPSGAVTETANYLRAVVSLKEPTAESGFDPDKDLRTVAKITKDNGLQVCGYRICDIVYPYDLIASPGESITSVLDKLVKMLGNFEYFYDVDGRFIFQKKKTYVDVSYNNILNEHSINEEVWADNSEYSSKYSYTFDKDVLVSSFQNNPNLSNLKNDYSLWGNRKSGDIDVPIHMRYAIDHKPFWYKSLGNKESDKDVIYCTQEGLDRYNGVTKAGLASNERLRNLYNDYPAGLDKSWFKLNDWLFLYGLAKMKKEGYDISSITENEEVLAFYPDSTTKMGSSSNGTVILDRNNYQTLGDLKNVFDVNVSYNYSDDKPINIFDVSNETGKIVYIGHGIGCSHTYLELLNDQTNRNRTIWVYDPRLTGKATVNTSIPSVLTEEEINVIEEISNVKIVDWREIIFQMANDYRRHYRDEDFLISVRDANKWTSYYYVYPKGYTGYEKYYIDFEMNLSQGVVAYWRELYNIDAAGQTGRYIVKKDEEIGISKNIFESDKDASVPKWENPKEVEDYLTETKYKTRRANIIELLNAATTDVERESRLRELDTLAEQWENTGYSKDTRVRYKENIYKSLVDHNISEPGSTEANWLIAIGDFSYNSDGWNPDILNNPERLNFWFDFLDTTGELNKYSVCNIGQRSKATNDDKIKAIYFRETPNVIFELADNIEQANWIKPGYAHIRIPKGLDNMFAISSRGKNAMDVIQEYLYTYTYPISAITLNAVPIYYLTPNTLIYVDDVATGTVGEYIMQKFSFQFGLTSQMTINAVETAKRIY